MRHMSFALTTKQIKSRTKTVTRRLGWTFLKPGDLIQPVEVSIHAPSLDHRVSNYTPTVEIIGKGRVLEACQPLPAFE